MTAGGLAVFDLDGTLVDTPRGIVESFTATLAGIGAAPCAAADIRATIGRPLDEAFAGLMGVPLDDPLVPRALAGYRRHFAEIVLPRAPELVFPGVVAGLAALQDHGVTLAVATSKLAVSAEALLVAAGLWERFATVVGADDVARPKPHPDSGLLVLERLGVPAERAVMVGDTTHDIFMAAAVGMRSVAVTYGVQTPAELSTAGPTWTVDGFDAVVEILATHLGSPPQAASAS